MLVRKENHIVVKRSRYESARDEIQTLTRLVKMASNRVSLLRDISYIGISDVDGENLDSQNRAYIEFTMTIPLSIKPDLVDKNTSVDCRVVVAFAPSEGVDAAYHFLNKTFYMHQPFESLSDHSSSVSYLISDCEDDIREVMQKVIDYGDEKNWGISQENTVTHG